MNRRKELEGRLQEIKRTASELPGHEADIAQLHYQLTRLSNWVVRTINFLSTMETCQGCQDCQCQKQADLPFK